MQRMLLGASTRARDGITTTERAAALVSCNALLGGCAASVRSAGAGAPRDLALCDGRVEARSLGADTLRFTIDLVRDPGLVRHVSDATGRFLGIDFKKRTFAFGCGARKLRVATDLACGCGVVAG